MDMALFKQVADGVRGARHRGYRLHNGEAFVDRQPSRVRYAEGTSAFAKVGLISGSLVNEGGRAHHRGAGLDAIPASASTRRARVFEQDARPELRRQVIENIRRLLRLRGEAGTRRPEAILNFVRQDNSAEQGSSSPTGRGAPNKIHADLHSWAGTLGRESVVLNYPCTGRGSTPSRPGAVGRALSLCCAPISAAARCSGDLRTHSIAEIWNSRRYRQVRRDHLVTAGRRSAVVRPAEEGLAALGAEAVLMASRSSASPSDSSPPSSRANARPLRQRLERLHPRPPAPAA